MRAPRAASTPSRSCRSRGSSSNHPLCRCGPRRDATRPLSRDRVGRSGYCSSRSVPPLDGSLSLWTTVIPWGERRVELKDATGLSLDANPRLSPEGFTIAGSHLDPGKTRVTQRRPYLLGQRQDLARGQPSRGSRDPEACHADRPWYPLGQLEQLDREPTVVMFRDPEDLSEFGSVDALLSHDP